MQKVPKRWRKLKLLPFYGIWYTEPRREIKCYAPSKEEAITFLTETYGYAPQKIKDQEEWDKYQADYPWPWFKRPIDA